LYGRIELLTDTDRAQLAAAAFEILARIGLTVHHEGVLRGMEAMGCKVDFAAHVARIPEGVIAPIIEEQKAKDQRPEPAVTAAQRSARPYSASFYHNAPFILDWAKGEKRYGNRQDALDMVRLADVLPEVGSASCPLMMMELDPRIEPLHAQALLVRNARSYGSVDIPGPELVEYFAEMGRIVAGNSGRFMPGIQFTISPMTIDRRTCELVMAKARHGGHYESGSQATSGGNAPVTAAGTIALASAEILAGWVAARAMVPGIDLYGICCTGVIDMSSGNATFSSPETVLQDAAIVQLFETEFGGHTRAVGQSYIGAKAPGIQATMERAFKTMSLGSMFGGFGSVGAGILDNGNVFSPTQAMMDIEYGRMLRHFNRGIEVTEELIGFDTIQSVAGSGRNMFLDTEHTVEHFRDALWLPKLLTRTPTEDTRSDADRLLAAADQKWRAALRTYEPFELDPAVDTALTDLIERAERELLG